MLCCLLVSMLLAHFAALFRRGLARLRLALTGPTALWRQPVSVALIAVQAVCLIFVAQHWEHLAREVRTLMAPTQTRPPIGGEICTGGSTSSVAQGRSGRLLADPLLPPVG